MTAVVTAQAMMPAVTEIASDFDGVETETGRVKLQYPQLREGTALMRFRINSAVAGDMAQFQKELRKRKTPPDGRVGLSVAQIPMPSASF